MDSPLLGRGRGRAVPAGTRPATDTVARALRRWHPRRRHRLRRLTRRRVPSRAVRLCQPRPAADRRLRERPVRRGGADEHTRRRQRGGGTRVPPARTRGSRPLTDLTTVDPAAGPKPADPWPQISDYGRRRTRVGGGGWYGDGRTG